MGASAVMFWFKPRKVYVDCFTFSERVMNQYPVEKAANFIPEWWKTLPEFLSVPVKFGDPHKKPAGTMRSCTGFRDLYFKGLIIPLWADMHLSVYNDHYYYTFADSTSETMEHSSEQYGNSYPNYFHMKLMSPWFLKEKHGIKFGFIEPTWSFLNFSLDLRILPGVTQYDLYTQTNINMFIPRPKEEHHILMEAGQPVCHLIPLTEKNLVLKHHLVTKDEIYRMSRRHHPLKFYKDFETYRTHMKYGKGKK